MLGEGKEKQEVINYRKQKYKQTDRDETSFDWLRKGDLKKETEWLLLAAQDQALMTRSIRKHIDKDNINAACRLCGERDETVVHIVSECSMLSQKVNKNC